MVDHSHSVFKDKNAGCVCETVRVLFVGRVDQGHHVVSRALVDLSTARRVYRITLFSPRTQHMKSPPSTKIENGLNTVEVAINNSNESDNP